MIASALSFGQKKPPVFWFLRTPPGSGTTDTTSISNRIDAKVSKADSNTNGSYQSYAGTYRTRLDTAYGLPMLNSAKDSIIYSGLEVNATKDTMWYNNVVIYPSSSSAMTSGAISESLKVTRTNFNSYTQAKYFTSFFDDFADGSTNATSFGLGWTQTAINSGSATMGGVGGMHNSDSTWFGAITPSTGTNVAGGVVLQRTNTNIVPGNGQAQFEVKVRIPVLASAVGAGGQQFFFDCGFSNKIDATEYTQAVVFRHDSLSPFWKCITISGATDTGSTTIPIVADQTYKLRADINTYIARYYIDDVLVRTVTSATAVPNGVGDAFAPQFRIIKIGGATARTAEIDWYYYDKVFTATR